MLTFLQQGLKPVAVPIPSILYLKVLILWQMEVLFVYVPGPILRQLF